MAQAFKVTYATLTADNPELNQQLDAAFEKVRQQAGQTQPLYIQGKARSTEKTTDDRSPINTDLLVAKASSATEKDVNDAVAAAKAAFPKWSRTPYQERARLMDRAAEIIRERRFELTAWLVLEIGKSRVEALGEIEETADLYSYYADQLRQNEGYVRPMGKLSPADSNTSVLRPYGVWAVIAPWNFPYALLGAPVAAALLAGNTVVAKPSSETPLSGVKIAEIFQEAGFPPGTINLITGSGKVVGDVLAKHKDVDGVTFTGSYDVGFNSLFQRFSAQFPKPCIVEMGGKNPAIVTEHADLDRAVQGVYRSAFGMGGQKCSACSRVYVQEGIADAFTQRLVKMAQETKLGDPTDSATFLGPVGVKSGYQDYQRYIEQARQGGKVSAGGEVVTQGPFAKGYYVQPTVLTGLPRDHELMKKELFLPIVGVQTFKSLDQALDEANDTVFGLTAGLFSKKQEEIDTFLDRIQAGVVYVNRAAGATTGAWPGVQPFGGWKGSGSSGKNIGGLYTLPCYMREQSRTISG
jgi:1-pyrroline-5-carboxylate dehydrogenase